MKYNLSITDGQEILVLSPEIIGVLIENIRQSDRRVLTISAEILLPPGYAEYIVNVMQAKTDCINLNCEIQDVNDLVAKQILSLRIGEQPCFDKADAVVIRDIAAFYLVVNEKFFLLAKQPEHCFLYDDDTLGDFTDPSPMKS